MRRLMLLVLACAGSLTGCGVAPIAPEPVVRIVEVQVPVPIPCISALPARPRIYTRAEIFALPNAEAAARLIDQDNVLKGYVGELEAVGAECAELKPAGSSNAVN